MIMACLQTSHDQKFYQRRTLTLQIRCRTSIQQNKVTTLFGGITSSPGQHRKLIHYFYKKNNDARKTVISNFEKLKIQISTSFKFNSLLLDFNECSVKDSSSSKCWSRVLISLWFSFFHLRKASVLLPVILTRSSPAASLLPSIELLPRATSPAVHSSTEESLQSIHNIRRMKENTFKLYILKVCMLHAPFSPHGWWKAMVKLLIWIPLNVFHGATFIEATIFS